MKNKIQYESIVESESLCAPAVRMVLASVWLSPEGEAILFRYPVLAIRSRSNLVFSRAMNSNNEYATPEISAEAMLDRTSGTMISEILVVAISVSPYLKCFAFKFSNAFG